MEHSSKGGESCTMEEETMQHDGSEHSTTPLQPCYGEEG